jgi:hypothetical protein
MDTRWIKRERERWKGRAREEKDKGKKDRGRERTREKLTSKGGTEKNLGTHFKKQPHVLGLQGVLGARSRRQHPGPAGGRQFGDLRRGRQARVGEVRAEMVGEREKEGEWKKGFFFQSFFVSLSCFQPLKPPHTKKNRKKQQHRRQGHGTRHPRPRRRGAPRPRRRGRAARRRLDLGPARPEGPVRVRQERGDAPRGARRVLLFRRVHRIKGQVRGDHREGEDARGGRVRKGETERRRRRFSLFFFEFSDFFYVRWRQGRHQKKKNSPSLSLCLFFFFKNRPPRPPPRLWTSRETTPARPRTPPPTRRTRRRRRPRRSRPRSTLRSTKR